MAEEPDFTNIFDQLMGSVNSQPAVSVEVLVGNSTSSQLRQMIEDRICGLLLQETLTMDQIALLTTLMRGYRPCAH